MHGNKFLWRFPEEEGLFSIKNLDLVQIEEEKNPTISFDVGKKQISSFLADCAFDLTSLKVISIRNHCIKSVENFNRYQFNCLEYLQLDGNLLYSLKGLKKCSFQRLSNLSVSNDDLIQAKNAIQNFQIMTEIHCEKLMRISVDKELDQNSEQICWALKLNTLKIKSISIPKQDRIQQRGTVAQLKKKYYDQETLQPVIRIFMRT